MYRYMASSGPEGVYSTGWYNAFVPYLVDPSGKRFINKWMDAYFVENKHYGPPPMYLPRGMSSVPLEFKDLTKNTKEDL